MKAHPVESGEKRAIEGLLAEGANPELKEKMMLFGQFVGDWDILEDRSLQQDGTWTTTRGELHWGWILDGKAVQDVWMWIDEKTGKVISEGTTVRFYDKKIDAWHSIWLAPNQGAVKTFIARQVGDEIVLEGRTAEGYLVKWIFSDITQVSFRWRAEEKRGKGNTWMLVEEMRIRRRPESN